MQMDSHLELYRRALDEGSAVVRDVGPADLDRPSPCAGWDLRALLAHMIGQNHGFADALERAGRTDAPVEAFAPRPIADDAVAVWTTSVERVATAFTTVSAVSPDAQYLLVEVSIEQRVPLGVVLAMHLLDTVVHTWDVATAQGHAHRPDDELAGAVAAIAPMVPDGPSREAPGAAFGPVLAAAGTDALNDDWTATLASLGRRSGVAQRGSSRPAVSGRNHRAGRTSR